MNLFTWILLALTVFILGLVLYSMVKDRWAGSTSPATGATPPKRKFGWMWTTLITLVIVGLVIATWVSRVQVGNERERAEEIARSKVVVVETTKYHWYWRLTSGSSCGGRTESARDEQVVERVDENDPNILNFNLYYDEHGSIEQMRIRLTKIDADTWQGIWEQPDCSGTITVDEVAPGVYSGQMTWDQTGALGLCKISKK